MKIRFKKLTPVFFLFLSVNLWSQKPEPPKPPANALYAELLGNGFLYSLNYDRLIYHDENLSITARAGLTPGFVNLFRGIGIPIEVNGLFLRKNGHSAEAGPGFCWFNGKSTYRNDQQQQVTTLRYNALNVTLRLGYRYTQPGGGLILRAAFIPVFSVVSSELENTGRFLPFNKPFTPWAGVSVGYTFKHK
jgi:hypothetical protein